MYLRDTLSIAYDNYVKQQTQMGCRVLSKSAVYRSFPRSIRTRNKIPFKRKSRSSCNYIILQRLHSGLAILQLKLRRWKKSESRSRKNTMSWYDKHYLNAAILEYLLKFVLIIHFYEVRHTAWLCPVHESLKSFCTIQYSCKSLALFDTSN